MAIEVTQGFFEFYGDFLSQLPTWSQNFINLFLLVLVIVIYSVFIWKFYRFIGKKNIIGLNLNKYNKSNHPFFEKLVAGILYLVEYVIILPFLIFFWFAIFTLFLIFLSDKIELGSLLIIAATIIAAIRMTSYIPRYGENLAKEIAKLLPFMLLANAVLNSNSLNFQAILLHLQNLGNYFNHVFNYLLFIILLEIILRIFDFVFSFLGIRDSPKIEEEEKEED